LLTSAYGQLVLPAGCENKNVWNTVSSNIGILSPQPTVTEQRLTAWELPVPLDFPVLWLSVHVSEFDSVKEMPGAFSVKLTLTVWPREPPSVSLTAVLSDWVKLLQMRLPPADSGPESVSTTCSLLPVESGTGT
jgi:hypothetical protein